MLGVDLALVVAAFVTAYHLGAGIRGLYPFEVYTVILAPLLIIWGCCLNFFGMYDSLRTKGPAGIIAAVLKTNAAGFIIFGSFMYVFRLYGVSRAFVGFIFVLASVLIIIEKTVLSIFFKQIRRRGLNYRQMLVVGTGRRAQGFIETVRRHSEWGLRVIGLVDEDPARRGDVIAGCPVLGSLDDVSDIIHTRVVDEIVFVVPHSWFSKIEPVMQACEIAGVRVHVAVAHFEMKLARAKISDLHGLPLLTFDSAPDRVWHLLIKRVFDICFSGAALVFLSPLFLAIAAAVKLSSPGGVFFRQQRIGLSGRAFTLVKFRTMIAGAEEKLKDLKCRNEMRGPVFKMRDDPRITPVGWILRKFSLDELPQLWNVLKGDMSLIGPRPPLPSEVKEYERWHRRRLSMRPGLSCFWQVSGRNKISDFNRWVRLDLDYIDNWSLWLDAGIFFRTIPVVFFGFGAK